MKVLNIEEYGEGVDIHLELTEEEVELMLKATNYKYYIESAIVQILEESVRKEATSSNKMGIEYNPKNLNGDLKDV